MSGKLIVFEGTDGSGKATQAKLLCETLAQRGIAYREIDFPRYGNPLPNRRTSTSTEPWATGPGT